MERTIAMAVLVGALACGGGEDSGAELDLAARGEHYYQNVCIACHNGDPTRDGALGPAVAGSSLELIQAKTIQGEYPPGYTPKRDTQAMPRFEYLAPEVPSLAAYLGSFPDS